jgi:phosphatidylinositol alpha-1,6-mannosyltransferase
MACGAPVVAIREGGITEAVLHQKTGLLVEREPSSFAQAIRLLLDDPALAEEYGRQGRLEVLANWSWESAVNSLEHHLTAALQPAASQLGAQRPAVA